MVRAGRRHLRADLGALGVVGRLVELALQVGELLLDLLALDVGLLGGRLARRLGLLLHLLRVRELDIVVVHQVADHREREHDERDHAAHHRADGKLLRVHARARFGLDAVLLELRRRFDLRAPLRLLQSKVSVALDALALELLLALALLLGAELRLFRLAAPALLFLACADFGLDARALGLFFALDALLFDAA